MTKITTANVIGRIIREAERFESLCKTSILKKNYSEAAILQEKAYGLRMAAEIVSEEELASRLLDPDAAVISNGLKSGYTVLDLFSGCGGFSAGFVAHGNYRIVAANDIWAPAMDTYCLNHPETKFVLGDITDSNIKRSIVKLFRETGCDVIIGGPPCQAYSMAGLRDPNDPRGKLFEDYVCLVKTLSPNLFVMENVPGILTMKHGGELVTTKIVNRFSAAGYKVEFRRLDAADYGVPQHRERVIFIGTRHNVPIVFPDPTHSEGGSIDGCLAPYVTVKNAIDDLKDAPENAEFSHIFSRHSEAFVKKIAVTPIGKSVTKNYSDAFFRAPPNKPSRTVKGNHGSVFVHYAKDRCMTPRELARLQSFPDNFRFIGTKHDQFVMIGNAVPCGLAKAIAGAVKKMMGTTNEK